MGRKKTHVELKEKTGDAARENAELRRLIKEVKDASDDVERASDDDSRSWKAWNAATEKTRLARVALTKKVQTLGEATEKKEDEQ